MVEKELKPVYFVLPLVCSHPYCVNTADEDAEERDDNAHPGSSLDGCSSLWGRLLIVVRDESHTKAHGNESVGCHSRNSLAVEEEVDDGDTRSEKDTGNLVEGDGRNLEGKIHADYVHGHGDGER